MRTKTNTWLTVALAAIVAGCAQHTWAPGPTAQGTFEQANARCSLMSRHSGGGYYAQGTPAFVGGAVAGAAIGEAIRAQADYNDCMFADGWVATDAKTKPNPAQTADRERFQAMENDLKICLATVRANPKYASIVPHLVDISSGKYSLTQMADTSLPTPDDGKTIASYGDEADQCRAKLAEAIGERDPRMGQTISQQHSLVNEMNLRLIQRRITWGQYAKAMQDLSDQASACRPLIIPAMTPASAEIQGIQPQKVTLQSPGGGHICTHQEQVQARIARQNGYTNGPVCD